MNLWNKWKKEKTEKAEIKTADTEKKSEFSFRDALENLKQILFGKVAELRDNYKKSADQSMQSDEMMDLSSKLRIHKNKVRIRTAAILTALLAVSVGYGVYHNVRVFKHYTVVSSTEQIDDHVTQHIYLKKGCTLKCNPNGVTCVDRDGTVQWNTTFTMQNPVTDVCGTTVAIADQRGNDVYIFNEKGLIGNFKVEYTLTKIKVAKQGVAAVILEDGDVTWINVYDSQGNIIVKNKTSVGKTGYPLDMDISSDGLKMAVSYAGIQNQVLESRVDFYNFSSVGKDKENNLVNEVVYDGKVVPQIRFLDDDYVVGFRDDGATIFHGKHIPEEKKEIIEEKEIVSTFCNDDYIGIITESDEEENAHKYKMELYRENGSKCFQTYFDMDYEEVVICNEEVLIYGNSELKIYSTSGKLKYSAEYEKTITEVMPVEGFRKYRVITPDSIDIIKIR